MRVNLDELEKARAYIRSINDCPLEQIEWIRSDKLISVDPKLKDDWKYIGLSNVEFAELKVIDSTQDQLVKG